MRAAPGRAGQATGTCSCRSRGACRRESRVIEVHVGPIERHPVTGVTLVALEPRDTDTRARLVLPISPAVACSLGHAAHWSAYARQAELFRSQPAPNASFTKRANYFAAARALRRAGDFGVQPACVMSR